MSCCALTIAGASLGQAGERRHVSAVRSTFTMHGRPVPGDGRAAIRCEVVVPVGCTPAGCHANGRDPRSALVWERSVELGGRHGRTPYEARPTRLPRRWLGPRRQPRPLPRSWAWTVGAGWPLLFVVMTAVAVEPADPNAVPTLVDSAVFVALMVGLFGTIAARGHPPSKGVGVVNGPGGRVGGDNGSNARSRATTTPWAGSGTPSGTSSSTLLLLSLTGILVLRTPSLPPKS